MTYRVHIDEFQGPMDLLLYLIRKSEVDIKKIPVAAITKQYLEYIQLMRMLNLDVAGDFIVMASTLLRIKAKMLLPKTDEEEEEAEDPRSELIRNLLEYKEYKKLADTLEERENEQRRVFYRIPPFEPDEKDKELMIDVSLFDLLAAFKDAIEAAPDEVVHEVDRTDITIEERVAFISQYLADKKQVLFTDMFPKGTAKLILVVTFMALLELIKLQKVRIGQTASFGEIWIFHKEPAADAAAAPASADDTGAADAAQRGATDGSQ